MRAGSRIGGCAFHSWESGIGFQPMKCQSGSDHWQVANATPLLQNLYHSLTETVNKRPMGAFFGRLFHRHNNEVTAGALGNNMSGRKMALLPPVAFFGELPFRIVDVDR